MGTVSTQQTRVCLAPGGLAESLLPPYPQQAQVDNSDLHRQQNTGHLGAYIHRTHRKSLHRALQPHAHQWVSQRQS